MDQTNETCKITDLIDGLAQFVMDWREWTTLREVGLIEQGIKEILDNHKVEVV